MALILKKIVRGYFTLFYEKIDTRSDGLLFMSSVFVPIAIGAVYLYFILNLGPRLMKNRPPLQIDNVIKIYNLIQVMVNSYICYYGFTEIPKLNWRCAEIDFSRTEHNMFTVRVVHLYFLTKVSDLIDTIFFVLRKKESHISFLHVYHHFGMIGLGWAGTRFFAGGHSIYLGVANAFVHVIMYFYYLLTVWNPEWKKNIWWKKYITQLQLIQFVFFFVIYGQLLFKPDCGYPKIASYFITPQSFFMILLFGDFYIKTYVKRKLSNEGASKKQS